MSARRLRMRSPPTGWAGRQRGLSLIEMMVAVLIALFLIAGIIVVEQGVKLSYNQQTGLSQLQDEQRFASSILSGVIGTAGYYPDPESNSVVTALPAATVPGGAFAAGQAVVAPATAAAAPHDQIFVRYMTVAGDGVTLCDGTQAGNNVYTSYLYVTVDASGNGTLYCQLETGKVWGTAVPLVTGVTDMQILYGVATGTSNSVTEYVYGQDVPNWSNVTSVQVTLTFTNPLYKQNALTTVQGQKATMPFTRVISIMGRVGAQ